MDKQDCEVELVLRHIEKQQKLKETVLEQPILHYLFRCPQWIVLWVLLSGVAVWFTLWLETALDLTVLLFLFGSIVEAERQRLNGRIDALIELFNIAKKYPELLGGRHASRVADGS